MSSYYDDPDFADEYLRRDEEALATYFEEQEREELHKAYLVHMEEEQRKAYEEQQRKAEQDG